MEYLIGEAIPPLRQDLEMVPIVHEGQPVIVLSDLLGLQEETFVVSPAVLMVASLFDGERRLAEVHQELVKQKLSLSQSEIQTIVDDLKKNGLLETPETRSARQLLFDRFQKSSVRKFSAKARGIPENPLDFGLFMGRFFKDPKGPGEPFSGTPSGKAPLGLVSPHIDFFRGGPHYAWAYGELAKRPAPDVIVAVGVAHISPKSPWILTQKSYETPLGPVEVDASLYEEIRGALWYDPLADEWAHAKEHSLEFQALWLKHIWMKDTPKWVPILCSNFESFCTDQPPSSISTIEDAINKIGKILADRAKKGQKIMVLAGIDLAHVGRRFGDEMEITDDLKKKIEELDRASLEKALKLDADSFFMAGAGENAWRKVCGLSALYTSLRWIKGLSNGKSAGGRLLTYDQAPDPIGGVVSFTSAIFEA